MKYNNVSCPSGRSHVRAYRAAGLKLLLCSVVLLLGATIGHGQWLETTVSLPDSSGPYALCYSSQDNKVYCASAGSRPSWDTTVTVIDGMSDQVLRTITVGEGPIDFCHNPVQNRVYVANCGGSSFSVLRDSGGGVQETPNAEVRTANVATIVRGVLLLGHCPRTGTVPKTVLLDISGRRVMDLHPGPNDVRSLAPGVYFVRSEPSAESRRPSAVRKVIITR